MAYSPFTSIAKVIKKYKLKVKANITLFHSEELLDFEPSEHLLQDMEDANLFPLATEKAKSEWIISPILKELKKANPDIAIFSGFALRIEGEGALQGNPDYVLTTNPLPIEVLAPIFCLGMV